MVLKFLKVAEKSKKSSVRRFLHVFQKMRPLCSEPLKIKDFSGFSNSFWILDIYKCPKPVCESRIGKKV